MKRNMSKIHYICYSSPESRAKERNICCFYDNIDKETISIVFISSTSFVCSAPSQFHLIIFLLERPLRPFSVFPNFEISLLLYDHLSFLHNIHLQILFYSSPKYLALHHRYGTLFKHSQGLGTMIARWQYDNVGIYS